MAADKITLWNLALSAVGSSATVSSPDERSREANLCRLWYDLVRDNILKAAPWPSALTVDTLALTSTLGSAWDNTGPSTGYRYAYALPSDILAPRHLSTWAPFTLSWSAGQKIKFLSTNQEHAILHYTFVQDEVGEWDSGLQNAVVHGLAAALVLPLSGKQTLYDRLYAKAQDIITLTRAEVGNASDQLYERVPESVVARGFAAPISQNRYHYPFAEFNLAGV